jgi:hypothetical protein
MNAVQLADVERKLSWLRSKLKELIPGYTDGMTQKFSCEEDGLPKDSSGEGATRRALT